MNKNVTLIDNLPYYQKFIKNNPKIPVEAGMSTPSNNYQNQHSLTCLDFVEHYEKCPLCSKIYKQLYKHDNLIYIIIIIILSILLIIIIKHILKK